MRGVFLDDGLLRGNVPMPETIEIAKQPGGSEKAECGWLNPVRAYRIEN